MALNKVRKRYLVYGLSSISVVLIFSAFSVYFFLNKQHSNVTATFIPPFDTSCTAGTNNTYDIGPGEPYTTLGSFTWGSLQPGDMVRIHYQPGGYHEHIILSASGTAQNHVTICGVPGPQGQLPAIDESNATVSTQFNNHAYYANDIIESLAPLTISLGPNDTNVDGLGQWSSYQPEYMDIKNLEVTASNGDTYTDSNGNTVTPSSVYSGQTYNDMQGIYIWTGSDITFTNVDIHGTSGDGFFVNDGNRTSSYITLQGSRVYDNGIPTSDGFHNTYTEADHMLYQYDWIGPLCPTCGGSSLKDRSAGTVIRDNYIEGGGHLIDLVEAQNDPSLATLPEYQNTYVYGNTLVNGPNNNSALLVHFGEDSGGTVRPNLHFYNNSVFTESDQTGSSGLVRYGTVMFQIEGGTTAYVDNNMFYGTSYTPGQTASPLSLTGNMEADGAATLNLGTNWISPGWSNGTPYCVTVHLCTITVNGDSNMISSPNNNPGWTSTTYSTLDPHLTAGSPAIGVADTPNTFDNLTSTNYPVDMEYVAPQSGETRGNAQDLGAFAYDPTYSASTLCIQLPNAPSYQLPVSSVTITNGTTNQPISTYNNVTPATNGQVSLGLTQADGTTLQSLQTAGTPVNVTLSVPGYIPLTTSNITQPLKTCTNASQGLLLGDFSSSGKIGLSDIVTAVRAYNQVSDSGTQVVYAALGNNWPTLSQLVAIIRNYNTLNQ